MRTRITNIIMTPGVENEKHIPFIHDAEILIDGNRIVYAGPRENAPAFEADETIVGRGELAMPGLCNLHTHTPMTLMRGTGNDLTLEHWLNDAIYPLERHLTDDIVKAGSELGCMEMIRFGTTSFNDMYMHMDMLAETVRDFGLRATLCYGVADFDESCTDLIPGIELIEKWQNREERIRVALGPHSDGATTPKLLTKVREAAEKYHVPVHIHVSETRKDRENCLAKHGMTPPQYLDSLGLTDCTLLAAHCVWLTDEDIELFAKKKSVYVLHNPMSNLKLASGIAPISRMLDAGCRVTLGTDGVASNNDLNMWKEMRVMPLLQKGTTLDATVVTPAQVLASATRIGAEALGYTDLGLLKPGYLADLILVDLDVPNMWPCNDLETNLLYSAQGNDVTMTMVGGKVLYRDGKYLTLNPVSIRKNADVQRDLLFGKQ